MSRTWLKWVPAVAVPAVIASVAIASPMTANAAVSLPSKTAQQVLSLIASDKVTAFSGAITQTSSLGLPSLPASGSSTSSSLGAASGAGNTASLSSILELATGSHSARIYADGPSKMRVQVLDSLAERDAVRNGTDVWLYDSGARTAEHLTVPSARPAVGSGAVGSGTGTSQGVHTPAEIAHSIIAASKASTSLSVGDDLRVAGRSAYDLILTPTSSQSLVGSVSIAVDSATGTPLSVSISARGQKAPAIRVAFTSISFSTPPESLFTFTAPAGTKETTKVLSSALAGKNGSHPLGSHAVRQGDPTTGAAGSTPNARPTISGTGWASIAVIPANSAVVKAMSSPMISKLTTPLAGGRLFHTSLVNVFVTSDGRVLIGSVAPALLQAAAATQ